MDQNLLMVLNSFQLGAEVLERFAESGIRYHHLSALYSMDLEMLGVNSPALQLEMLTEFQNLEGQDPHFKEWVECRCRSSFTKVWTCRVKRNIREHAATAEKNVIDLLQSQLSDMNLLIAASIMKVGAAQSSQAPGVVVNNNFNSPEIVLLLLRDMRSHAEEMTELIEQLQNPTLIETKSKELKKRSFKEMSGKTLILLSGIIVGLFVAKTLRGGKKFL